MTRTRPARGSTVTVGAAYAVQGAGYATVVTALPAFQERHAIGDGVVAGLLLGVCLAAAVGSVLADVVAVRLGSRQALCAGLTVQALALAVAALTPSLAVFVAAVVVYGVGLGAVDAAGNMQGVAVQRARGVPLLGRFYAAYTAAAGLGALTAAAVAGLGLPAPTAVLAAAAAQLVVAARGVGRFDPGRAVRDATASSVVPLPRRGVWLVGTVVAVAFVVDSAVSTWSTVHLDDLGASAALAPLGYAAYQGAVLLTRLVTDPLLRLRSRSDLALAGVAAGTAGFALVALVGAPGVVIVGLAATGVAVGFLVPLAFSAAGELAPARSDEVVARVNLFNYAGVVLGAVTLGLLAEGPGLAPAFLLPAALLVLAAPVARRALAPPPL